MAQVWWKSLFLAALVTSGAGAASAQTPLVSLSAGGTIGAASNGNSWSGGGVGPLAAAHVDLMINSSRRVRLEAGTTAWKPTNEALDDIPAGRVRMTHVGFLLLGNGSFGRGLPTAYGGVGLGRYFFSADHGAIQRPDTTGVQFVGGLEFMRATSRRRCHIETRIGFVGGPGHNQVWAYTLPILSVAAGMDWRF